MRNIDYVISKIRELQISEEDYIHYERLLSLPKEVYVPVIYAIVDGKLKARDMAAIMSEFREEVFKDKRNLPAETISERIFKKYLQGTVMGAILDKGITSEQQYIYNKLKEKGVSIREEDVAKIFVSESNMVGLTLNFDEIDLTLDDLIFASDNGLSDTQMRKLILLRNYLLFRKRYQYQRKEE